MVATHFGKIISIKIQEHFKNITNTFKDKKKIRLYIFFYNLALSQLMICRPPPSVLIRLIWMMGSVLYSMGKVIKKFSDFYFSSYHEKFIKN